MGQVIVVLALGIGLTVLFQRNAARMPRSGGGGGNPFGAIDEVFSPARHEGMEDLQRQYDRTAPAPMPGEPPWVDIDLDGEDRPTAIVIRPERRPGKDSRD